MDKLIGLGRLRCEDERDRQYLLPRRAEAATVTSRYWNTPAAFDQGATSQCVAYSGVRYLVSGPIRNEPVPFNLLYNECQKIDEWPGEDYDGTSVRALMKVFQKWGLVSEYRWAFEGAPIIDHLLLSGPCVLGTLWTDEMANIRNDGYLTLGDLDQSGGGHAYCLIGANRKKRNPDKSLGAVRGVNSWGTTWGPHKGRFWLSFTDLDKLIKADGEACVATEI